MTPTGPDARPKNAEPSPVTPAWSPARSVRARFALVIGLSGLLFALGVSVLIEINQREQLSTALREASLREAQFLGQTLSLSLKERILQIRQVAAMPEVASGMADPGKLRLALEQVRSQHSELVWLAIVDAQGKVEVATGTLLEAQVLSSQPWYVEGLKAAWVGVPHPPGPLANHLAMDAEGKPPKLIDLSVPIIDYEGRTIGVVVAMLDWASVRELHATTTQLQWVVDAYNIVLSGLLVLGGGTAGTIAVNKLRKRLPGDEWQITVIDRFGDPVATVKGQRSTVAELAADVQRLTRYRGPVTLRPTIWLISGGRIAELTGDDMIAAAKIGRAHV